MSDIPPDKIPEINLDPFLQPRPELGNLSIIDAMKALAQGQQEITARLAVSPLPIKSSTLMDNISKIAEAVGNGLSKINFGSGSSMEKEAVQMFFDMGRETMRTQVLTNRALQRRIGGDILSSAPSHVVVTG